MTGKELDRIATNIGLSIWFVIFLIVMTANNWWGLLFGAAGLTLTILFWVFVIALLVAAIAIWAGAIRWLVRRLRKA